MKFILIKNYILEDYKKSKVSSEFFNEISDVKFKKAFDDEFDLVRDKSSFVLVKLSDSEEIELLLNNIKFLDIIQVYVYLKHIEESAPSLKDIGLTYFNFLDTLGLKSHNSISHNTLEFNNLYNITDGHKFYEFLKTYKGGIIHFETLT